MQTGIWLRGNATLLAGASVIALLLGTTPVRADETIGGGAVEVVESGGTGTKPSPWVISGRLYVGSPGTGALAIRAGGLVSNEIGVIGGSTGTTGSVTVADAGTVWNNSGNLFVGNSGFAAMAIVGGGSVINVQGYIGQSSGSNGLVIVTGVGSNWSNSSTLIIANVGTAALTIADGGLVSSDYTILGSGTTGIATVNINGSSAARGVLATGQVAESQGSGTLTFDGGVLRLTGSQANLFSGFEGGDVTIASGGVFIDTQGFAVESAYGLAGAGGLTKQGSGTLTLTGASSYSGDTTVSGGTLIVNGTLGGAVNVIGSRLGGSGTVGALALGTGSTLAPGNSVGTLSVTGDLSFAPGSVYAVEVNDGGDIAGVNNDLIAVSGAATISGGTVNVLAENGSGSNYQPIVTYTILTAAGGVSGAFDTVSDTFAFLDASLTYNTNAVLLTLVRNDADLASVGVTGNQQAVGAAAQSLGTDKPIYRALVVLSDTTARSAFDQLSGEIHASAKTALIEDSRFAREAALDRLRIALGGVGAGAGQATNETAEGTNLWIQAFGSRGDWASDGNAAEMSRNIGGLFMGADAEVTDDVYLGLMGGYSRSSFSVAERMSSVTVDSYTLGAYAGGEWDAFSLKGGLAHSWNMLDASRSVAFTGFSDSLSASYNSRTFQAYTEAAYTIEAGNARFEPFANLAHVNLTTDGFTETGGAAALTSAGDVISATFTTLGLRAETNVALGETDATLRGMLAWQHAFGNTPTATHSFASGGNAFTVAGVPIARDTLVLEAGFDVNITDAATLGLSYNGQFGSGLADHAAKASLGVKF